MYTRGEDTTHDCPAVDCVRRAPWHLPLCSEHWENIPLEVKRELLKASA